MVDRSRRVRRSPWLRITALASAVALSLATSTDAYGLHHCPHHDALPSEGTSGSGDHAEPARAEAPHGEPGSSGHAAHGAHAEHVAPADDEAATHDAPDHDAACTCVGDCAHAGATGVLPAPASSSVAVVGPVACVGTISVEAPLAAHTPHVLPFAQAPPLDR